MSCHAEKTCGDRVLTKTLAVGETGIYGVGIPDTAHARVGIPSVLLHVTICVFARNQNGGARVYNASEKWQITPQAIFNGDQPLTPVFVNSSDVATTRSLPDSYEVETGIKACDVSVLIAADGIRGKFYVQAIFEPAVGGISDKELADLFSRCELNLLGKYVVVS